MPDLDRLKVALTRRPWAYELARRPYALGRFALRRPHEPDYAAFALFPQTDRVFLDVGANAGMSAFSFRTYQRRAPIVSVEPNPFHERDLRFAARFVKPFSYRLCAAGERADEMTLHVPVYRGVPLTTEGALDRADVAQSTSLRARLGERMDGPDFTIEERRVPVLALDDLDVDPAFVKIDVQGHDHPAVQGLRATIERSRPVLMIERASQETHRVLIDLGYAAQTYDQAEKRLVSARWPAVNVFYVPA